MKGYSIFFKLHKILGAALSILFVMWFLSGIVMMYRTYPKILHTDVLQHAAPLDTTTLPLATLFEKLPSDASVQGVTLYKRAGLNIARIATTRGEYLLNAVTGERLAPFSATALQSEAARWGSEAVLTGIHHDLDVWLIGVGPFKEYPVYHYALQNEEQAELYLSSRTGEPLQYTTAASRFWAWVGAIPHWIYIKQLRATGRRPWSDVVLWLSGFGIAMTIAGIVAGLRMWFIARKRKVGVSPYRKMLFKWHHWTGLLFGLFVLIWIFSGFMSLAQLPEWMVKVYEPHDVNSELYGTQLHTDNFVADYRTLLQQGDVKQLTLLQLGNEPLYKVEYDGACRFYRAAAYKPLEPFTIHEAFCRQLMQQVRGVSAEQVTVSKLTAYDNYYISMKNLLPLPVYKISVADADDSCYYLNPDDGSCRYFNRNTRVRSWLYRGLHCFQLPYFVEHRTLKLTLMWLLLVGGTIASITGCWLGVRYLKRNSHW